jgi:hypothetical protein
MENKSMISDRYPLKIITLWSTFLLGTLFHAQLGLMPLFHGQSVTISEARDAATLGFIFWSMLIFFVLPMFAMIGTAFYEGRRYRIVHYGLTLVYTVLNLLHVLLDLMVKPIISYQISLMVILLLIGLLLNAMSYRWLKAYDRHEEKTLKRGLLL